MVSKTVEFSFHLLLKVAFLMILFGDFQIVYPQATINADDVEETNITEEEEPYRAGNCLIDAHLVYQEMLEDPTSDEIPGFPGTVKLNYNMNCTNQTDSTNTTLLSLCRCQDYNTGEFYACWNETHVDYLFNTTT
jgi:hypothetical protein